MHIDCRNYAPVDVVKGICHNTKKMVMAESDACREFEKLPKCKHCTHFQMSGEAFIGLCKADRNMPMTYPDLVTVTCEKFSWIG